MAPDPLVTLWRNTKRPLNWRSWQSLSDAEQSRMRYLLMDEMQYLEQQQGAIGAYHWRHAHRELLEVKAATGHTRVLEGTV